ncbi:MAG: hypothetical protein KatS3mg128_0643 [Silanimonas sp.]|nr:MAG: hypothetical protein KatS3mg128_0643 [Silanimonas sp.]
MAHAAPDPRSPVERRGRWYDRLGAFVATLCAIHCAGLPFVMALLPALGLEFLASHAFEGLFFVWTLVFAVLSVGHSLRQHGRFHAWGLLLAGLALLGLERLVPAIHDNALLHALVMTAAGGLVAWAHLRNLRRAHPPACGVKLAPLSDPSNQHPGVSHG